MNGRQMQREKRKPASGGMRQPSAAIVHQQSSSLHPHGFTLIELLIVISIVTLLMAVLLPTLQRVRKQAKAVVCQAKLRQWGIVLETYRHSNDGRFDLPHSSNWAFVARSHYSDCNDLLLCPMVAKRTSWPKVWHYGTTFEPWYIQKWPTDLRLFGSYGMNGCAYASNPEEAVRMPSGEGGAQRLKKWSAADVPVMLDSRNWSTIVNVYAKPPEFEGALSGPEGIGYFCINRHDGTVNGSSLDRSVRKVGLKELWTLKWLPTTDTRGPWTKAGGVQPEDWPKWMRGFKDY